MLMEEDESILFKPKPQNSKRCIISCAVVAALVAVVGILLGRFGMCPGPEPCPVPDGLYLPGVPADLMRDEDQSVVEMLMNGIKAENIRRHLRNLTRQPHLAGTEQNYILAKDIKKYWEDVGLDHVTLTPYRVMLSYPDKNDKNYVALYNSTGGLVFRSELVEPALRPEENNSNVVPPFNAYSGYGNISGDIVYVNYGRLADFLYLEQNTSINLTGKIVMARYGENFRGDKVRMAEVRGAKGVILFSDPADVTNGNLSDVYPHDWYLPGTGAQRGTVYVGDGDPLTPGYPAISTAYHKMSPENFIPSIPVHPIGYNDAAQIMSRLSGNEVPEPWKGGMNVSYTFGDGFKEPGMSANVYVKTTNQNATIYNVIGVIHGELEPDRYVMLGNHRDAWVFGALDPSSGTAVLMEIARVMGGLVKSGKWRPRRTIMFCNWGAEEYGLIGSAELVEHYTKTLGVRAVAYLNVDIALEGNFTFWSRGTPSLFESLVSATKKVPNPNPDEVKQGHTTVYDTWLKNFPSTVTGSDRPGIQLPGSGSDHAFFRDQLGVPVVDMSYSYDPKSRLDSYPMYHSVYETFYLVDEIMDRGFNYHRAVGQVWIEMARHLADSLVIPFNLADFSTFLHETTVTFLKEYKTQMENKSINTSLLAVAVANFTETVQQYQVQMKQANLKNPFVVRQLNDQLMQLNRAFLDPAGLPDRKLKRHILFADSSVDNYSGSTFPGLADALVNIRQGHDVERQWEIVRQHYATILFTIQSAASTLRNVGNFMLDYY